MNKTIKNIWDKLKEDSTACYLLIFGFFMRIIYIFCCTTPETYLWSDPGHYDNSAFLMAHNQYVQFSTYWPPFFHMWLSLIYRPLIWLGIENLRIKIDVIIFALLYIVGFWCIYKITEKLFSKKTALIILTILIFWYPFIFLNYLVMSENLFFPLIFLGLYFLIVKPLKPITGLWLGILWGFAFLARPVFALVLPLFVLWGLYYKINKKLLLNFVITIAVIIAFMMAFNFYYTDGLEKSVSSNGGVGFAMLWCDAKSIEFSNNGYGFIFGPPANIDYLDSKRISTATYFSNQKYYYQMGLNCLKQHPERLITNISSVTKLFYSHLFPSISNIKGWENLRLLFRFLTGLLFIGSLLTTIGLAKKWFLKDSPFKKYFYLFGMIIASLLATVYLQNVGEERYLIPYAPLLIILSTPFFLFLKNGNYSLFMKNYKINIFIILLVLIAASIYIRIPLLKFQSGDYNTHLSNWYDFIKSHGFGSFKYNFSDYTPLYTYFLGFFTLLPIYKLYSIKLLSIIFDFISAFFVFLIVKDKYKKNYLIATISGAAVLLAPTVIINSAYWGQCDAIYTAFLIGSVYFLLKDKPFMGLLFYGISFSLKFQSIFLFPLLIILFFKKRIKLLHFLIIPATYFLTIIPSMLAGRPFKDLLFIYLNQSKIYNSLSSNAPTLYQWLPTNDSSFYYGAGIIFALYTTAIFIYAECKNKKEITNDNIIKIAFLSVVLIPFMLPRMHDRYFFPADIFSIIFAFYFPKFFFIPILMQIISFLSYGPFLWGRVPNFGLVSLLVLVVILITAFDFSIKILKKVKKLNIPPNNT